MGLEKFSLEQKTETPETEPIEESDDFESCMAESQTETGSFREPEFDECAKEKDFQELTEYMSEHNYGSEDFEDYSKDPRWQELHEKVYGETVLEPDSARDALTKYMSEHNYGREDYAEYSRDPEWQKLHKAAYEQTDGS